MRIGRRIGRKIGRKWVLHIDLMNILELLCVELGRMLRADLNMRKLLLHGLRILRLLHVHLEMGLLLSGICYHRGWCL